MSADASSPAATGSSAVSASAAWPPSSSRSTRGSSATSRSSCSPSTWPRTRTSSSRFRREALAAARLVHPNIVQVFDFGLDERTRRNFIVMEFVDGQSCAEILREQGRSPDEAVEILAQSCRGLDYAHRNGVVHRDVKPGNLLRGREGMVKLADFGIAKAAEQSDITKVGSVLGTAAYLSPEQARGEPAGPASDLYALGVVAYQLLAGRLPVRRRLADRPRAPAGDRPAAAARRARARRRRRRWPPPSRARCTATPRTATPTPREMEKALRDGLRGRASCRPTATWAAEDTAATRMLEPDRRDLGAPAHLADRAAPAARADLRAAAPAPRSGPPAARTAAAQDEERLGQPAVRELLVVLALVAAGFVAYTALNSSNSKSVQLRQDVKGQVNDAVDQLRGLIEDNTQ